MLCFCFSRELFPTSDEEQQPIENDSPVITNDTEQGMKNTVTDETSVNDREPITKESSPSSEIDVKSNETVTTNDDIPSPFSSPIKLEQIIDNEQPIIEKDSSTENPSEFFYDFQPDNFHAEQVRCFIISINNSLFIIYLKGAPYVCTTCNGIGHLKSECPELIVPKMIDLPAINDKWIEILSLLCRQITGIIII